MNNLINACERENQKCKTIKGMLDELDAMLNGIGYEIGVIADAVYRGYSPTKCRNEDDEMPEAPPLAVIIENHVTHAETLLKELVKIREAMW